VSTCLFGIGGKRGFVPVRPKHIAEQATDGFFIIDDQDPFEIQQGLLLLPVK
jgi:hypothetical protein